MSSLLTRQSERPSAFVVRRTSQAVQELGSPIMVRQAISLVAVLGLFAPAFTAWNDIVSVPASGIAVVGLLAGALWLVAAVACARTESELDRLERWMLVLALLVLAAWTAAMLQTQGAYGTDEAALEQGGANLLLHGHDPYGANLLSALAGYSTLGKYATHTMTGGLVTTYGYPAVPLLLAAPFVLLTSGGQAIPIADMGILMVAIVVIFRQLPAGWRSLALVLCVGFPTLSGFALAGVNAIMAMTLLVVAVYRWTSTGQGGRLAGRGRLQAVALGLALGTNQLAWFLAPFLLTGIYLVRAGELGRTPALRVTGRYLGLAVGTFFAVNLPFIVWGPSAWLHGVASPLTQHAIPYGQGLIDLTLFLRVGGGALDAYNYGAALLYGALLVLYVVKFRRIGRAGFVLPMFALFVSGRSLGEYWMTMIAVMAVGALTAEDRAIGGAPELAVGSPAVRQGALVALFLPALACFALALTTPQPLSIRIVSARSSPRLFTVDQLQLAVTNTSQNALRPSFATNVTGQAVFWDIRRGPRVLAAHASAAYVLVPGDSGPMPANGTKFVVEAYTGSPRTVSSTMPFTHRGPIPGYW